MLELFPVLFLCVLSFASCATFSFSLHSHLKSISSSAQVLVQDSTFPLFKSLMLSPSWPDPFIYSRHFLALCSPCGWFPSMDFLGLWVCLCSLWFCKLFFIIFMKSSNSFKFHLCILVLHQSLNTPWQLELEVLARFTTVTSFLHLWIMTLAHVLPSGH